MQNQFRASRVKLARALQFIDEVDAGLREFDSSKPASARFIGKGTLEFHREEIPPNVNAALGDAIHNMRAALDLMATELARLNGKDDKGVYFPFAESKEELPTQIDNKNFYRAGDDAVELLKQFAPHKGGNEKLRAIHDLDIRDKHKSIIETRVVMHDLHLSYRLDGGPISTDASYSHQFLDGPLAGMPLIETSRELVQLVEGIIEEFARTVNLRNIQG